MKEGNDMAIKVPEGKWGDIQGGYILNALEQHFLNGDAYAMLNEVFPIVKRAKKDIPFDAFREDFASLVHEGLLRREGRRVYLRDTLRYEDSAATQLASILNRNELHCPTLPDTITTKEGVPLCDEQRDALGLALSHRLSIVLGGAGTGKSSLIQAIAKFSSSGFGDLVLCAPTGKAARNLAERTGLIARTVHSALGVIPDADFLALVCWPNIRLVVVDEASMLTTGMLAGILERVTGSCRVVLLGDPNQLLSVGSGNVLPDLLQLGVPHICLMENHRQSKGASELLSNVTGFSSLRNGNDLVFGESFDLRSMSEKAAKTAIVDEAATRYKAGESVQVLSPFNNATELSVSKLNKAIREQVNPDTPGKLSFGDRFRDGDKVIILNNDRDRDYSNGDVGILRIFCTEKRNTCFCVELPDGRRPAWHTHEDLKNIALAYALTVHKSQGSEYDTVLMPITDSFSTMLYRNLIYTAISRACRKVILYGSKNALSVAVQKPARDRRSELVAKCNMVNFKCA